MGNCIPKQKQDADEEKSPTLRDEGGLGTSMHSRMLRERKKIPVYDIYEKVALLGSGSMGYIEEVKVRPGREGGSAFHSSRRQDPNPKNSIITQSSTISNVSSGTGLSERRKTEVHYALKSIILDRISSQFMKELKNEISILKEMDHPNLVKAYETYDYKKQIFIIMELLNGGDLYTRSPYTEQQSAKIVGKLLSAIQYMHNHGIVHRDIKFENIIFESKAVHSEIKIIDFGLSKKFASSKTGVMNEGVGTLYTMSPQVLQGVYTNACDLWSLGVVTYMLLSAHRPFFHQSRKIMIDKIMRADYTFDKPYWKPISLQAKDMVDQLLVVDPRDRATAEQALQHGWLSRDFHLSDRKPADTVTAAVGESLVNFKHTSELKKIALNVIAHRSSTEEILELRQAFDQYDTANDGVITFEEFRLALQSANYPDSVVKEIFDSIDVNKNGCIMYTEFIAATLEAHGHIEEERIAEAFDRLDSDDSGYISKKNLRDFLGDDLTSTQIDDIIREADSDKDGQLSYEEFLQMFRKQTKVLVEELNKEPEVKVDDSATSLLGLDAKIPGGRFDSTVPEESKGPALQ